MESEKYTNVDVSLEEKPKGNYNKSSANTSKIQQYIGEGNAAKDSFVYLTLVWSFWVGIIITALLFINAWLFRENEKVPDVIGDVSKTWDLIIPLITLALGYAFGKSRK